MGLSYDMAVAKLCAWAGRNRPKDGKSAIRESEVRSQTRSAYRGAGYRSNGCEDPAVRPFCDPSCPVRGNGGKYQLISQYPVTAEGGAQSTASHATETGRPGTTGKNVGSSEKA